MPAITASEIPDSVRPTSANGSRSAPTPPRQERGAPRASRWIARSLTARGLRNAASIFISYLLLAVAFTWPLAARLGTSAPGVGEDTPIYLWNLWWIRQVVSQAVVGQASGSLFDTTMLFAPQGTSLALHSLTLLPGFIVLPISAFSPVAALGCVALLNCALNAATTYRLVNRLTGSPAASWVAGAMFAYSPWALGELQNHYNLDTLWPFVLYVDALLRLFARPRLASAAGVGLAFAAMVYADLQFPVLALLPTGVIGLAHLVRRNRGRDCERSAALRHGALGIALGLLLAAPLIAPALAVLRDVSPTSLATTIAEQTYYSADVTDFLRPSPLRAGGEPVIAPSLYLHSSRNSPSQFVQLGYSTLALAVFGLGVALSARRKPGRFAAALWGGLAVGGVLFALGPFLIVNGLPALVGGFFVPLPPGLLAALTPGINIERVPSRHMVSVTLALAVLAGTGLAWALGRLGGWRRAAVFAFVVATVLFELWPAPLPLEDYRTDPAYAAMTEPGAVLNVPFAAQDGHVGIGIYRNAVLTMGEQAMHGRPVVGGYVSRMPASSLRSVMDEPVLEYFAGCRAEAPSPDEVRSLLARYGVRYVIVHEDWPRVGSGPRGCGSPPDDDAVAILLSQSLPSPIARSESSVIYATR